MTRIGTRAFIYALLFTFLLISMMDRINMSVAGSSFAGRFGTRRAVACAVAFWSVFQMRSGLAPSMMALLFAGRGLDRRAEAAP